MKLITRRSCAIHGLHQNGPLKAALVAAYAKTLRTEIRKLAEIACALKAASIEAERLAKAEPASELCDALWSLADQARPNSPQANTLEIIISNTEHIGTVLTGKTSEVRS